MREDKFKIGDMVTMIPIDDYENDNIQQDFWRKHGRDPHPVEEIEQVAQWGEQPKKSAKHSQLVWVCGQRFSGYWFNPVHR
jgi:hypothetical protein